MTQRHATSRRTFLKRAGLLVPASLAMPSRLDAQSADAPPGTPSGVAPTARPSELSADVIIVGGGFGGCAAALAAARQGLRVIVTEETDWIGGQLTSQAVPRGRARPRRRAPHRARETAQCRT